MSTPFLAEIRIIAFTYAPKGWALCNGQILPIAQNTALFSLMGTTYGGNGTTNFALPNLQTRSPKHVGPGYSLGQVGGSPTHTLSIAEIPTHNHLAQGSTNTADQRLPNTNVWAASDQLPYAAGAPTVTLHTGSLANAGGSQPHPNVQPYLVLNFCVALQGIFPSRS